MRLLVDHEINSALQSPDSLATDVEIRVFTAKASPIQPASLNLTIGGIFVPGTESGKPAHGTLPFQCIP